MTLEPAGWAEPQNIAPGPCGQCGQRQELHLLVSLTVDGKNIELEQRYVCVGSMYLFVAVVNEAISDYGYEEEDR